MIDQVLNHVRTLHRYPSGLKGYTLNRGIDMGLLSTRYRVTIDNKDVLLPFENEVNYVLNLFDAEETPCDAVVMHAWSFRFVRHWRNNRISFVTKTGLLERGLMATYDGRFVFVSTAHPLSEMWFIGDGYNAVLRLDP